MAVRPPTWDGSDRSPKPAITSWWWWFALTGGHAVSGPIASGVAGAVYKNLSTENYFAQTKPASPLALVSNQSCCN